MTDYAEEAAKALAEPPLSELALDMFSDDDLLKISLQRSELLYDQRRSGRLIRSWTDGDPAPLEGVVKNLGSEIARRGAFAIWREFPVLGPVLEDLKPQRIADIGCGFAFFDLFAHRITGADILLIDLEDNDSRAFGFSNNSAAYTSLATARRMLTGNGVPEEKIQTVNPGDTDVLALEPVDLACSFFSCGFHYPATTYRQYFEQQVKPGGAIIIDLRAKRAEQATEMFRAMGDVTEIDSGPKWSRILVKKPA